MGGIKRPNLMQNSRIARIIDRRCLSCACPAAVAFLLSIYLQSFLNNFNEIVKGSEKYPQNTAFSR